MTDARTTWSKCLMAACFVGAIACGPRSHPSTSGVTTIGNRSPRQASPEEVLEALESALPPLPLARRARLRVSGEPTSAFPRDPMLEAAEAAGDRRVHEHGTIRVGMSSDEAPALVPYLDELLDRVVPELASRYGVAAPDVRVEMYSSRDDLRTRLAGTHPYDVDGAYAAGVVVMVSPSGGAGNWGETLTHELAHAFQRARFGDGMPRWLAEGLAEADAHATRPEWTREPTADLARVLPRDGETLAQALTRAIESPTTEREQGDAYWLAMQLVEDVRAHATGPCTTDFMDVARPEAPNCPSIDALAGGFLDRHAAAFRDGLARHVPTIFANEDAVGDDAEAHARRGARALVEGDSRAAVRESDAALVLDAHHHLAQYVRARAAIAERDIVAVEHLARLAAESGAVEAHVALARAALASDDTAGAAAHLREALALGEPSVAAADLALRLAGRVAGFDAAQLRRRIVDLDERAAELGLEVVRDAERAGDWALVVAYGERLLYSVPSRPELHRSLASGYEHTGRTDLAARERRMMGRSIR